MIASCAAAVEEVAASRGLIERLTDESEALRTRLAAEQKISALYAELDAARRGESDALRRAADVRSETIAAKDAAIAELNRQIADLKRKRGSVWRRVGDVLIGVGAGLVLR